MATYNGSEDRRGHACAAMLLVRAVDIGCGIVTVRCDLRSHMNSVALIISLFLSK